MEDLILSALEEVNIDGVLGTSFDLRDSRNATSESILFRATGESHSSNSRLRDSVRKITSSADWESDGALQTTMTNFAYVLAKKLATMWKKWGQEFNCEFLVAAVNHSLRRPSMIEALKLYEYVSEAKSHKRFYSAYGLVNSNTKLYMENRRVAEFMLKPIAVALERWCSSEDNIGKIEVFVTDKHNRRKRFTENLFTSDVIHIELRDERACYCSSSIPFRTVQKEMDSFRRELGKESIDIYETPRTNITI